MIAMTFYGNCVNDNWNALGAAFTSMVDSRQKHKASSFPFWPVHDGKPPVDIIGGWVTDYDRCYWRRTANV